MSSSSITHAIVLAAGFGQRMTPLTQTTPKPLVQVAGRPLIDYMLDRLHACGIQNIVVNVHYLADKLEAYLAELQMPAITISDEREKILDTGGALVKAKPLLGEGCFFACNSDSLWTGDDNALIRMMRSFDPHTMDALLLVVRQADTPLMDGTGDFFMDSEGKLTRPPNHTPAPFFYTGVQIISPTLLAGAPVGTFSCNLLWDKAIKRGHLYGTSLEGTWFHVGRVEDIKRAEHFMEAL